MVNLIVAVSKNNIIGNKNTLVWNIPDDLKRFKFLTTNNTIIMGRKTYQSIGKKLPNRLNIVVSKQKGFNAPGCIVVDSIEKAIKKSDNKNDIFVIGGANIYNQFLEKDLIDKVYLTKIYEEYEGDTVFDFSIYKGRFNISQVDRREIDGLEYEFIDYTRDYDSY